MRACIRIPDNCTVKQTISTVYSTVCMYEYVPKTVPYSYFGLVLENVQRSRSMMSQIAVMTIPGCLALAIRYFLKYSDGWENYDDRTETQFISLNKHICVHVCVPFSTVHLLRNMEAILFSIPNIMLVSFKANKPTTLRNLCYIKF